VGLFRTASKLVLHFVNGDQFGFVRGFSEYPGLLSSLHVDTIWLIQIRLADGFVMMSTLLTRKEWIEI